MHALVRVLAAVVIGGSLGLCGCSKQEEAAAPVNPAPQPPTTETRAPEGSAEPVADAPTIAESNSAEPETAEATTALPPVDVTDPRALVAAGFARTLPDGPFELVGTLDMAPYPGRKRENGYSLRVRHLPPGTWRFDYVQVHTEKPRIYSAVISDSRPGAIWHEAADAYCDIPPQDILHFLETVVSEEDHPTRQRLLGASLFIPLIKPEAMAHLDDVYGDDQEGTLRDNPYIPGATYIFFGKHQSLLVKVEQAGPFISELNQSSPPRLSAKTRATYRSTDKKPGSYSAMTLQISSVKAAPDLDPAIFDLPEFLASAKKVQNPQTESFSTYALTVRNGDKLQAKLLATLPAPDVEPDQHPREFWKAISQRPIPPPGNGVLTGADMESAILDVVRRDTLGAYEASPSPDAAWHADALTFLAEAAEVLGRERPDFDRQQAATELGLRVLNAGCEDPVILATFVRVAILSQSTPYESFPANLASHATMVKHHEMLAASPRVPPYVLAILGGHWMWCQKKIDDHDQETKKRIGTWWESAVQRSIHETASTKKSDYVRCMTIASRENSSTWRPYHPSHIEKFAKAVATAGDNRWYLNLMQGTSYEQMYWFMTGSDLGRKAPEPRKSRLKEAMQVAREPLMQSHDEWPADPNASRQMIRVAMATSNLAECRYWFEQSVATEMDNMTIYEDMARCLLPKWLGDRRYELLYAFALECLDSGHFQTPVPSYYATVGLHFIISDSKSNAILQSPNVLADLRRMSDGYIQDGVAIPGYEAHAGLVAYVEFLQGNYDEAAARAPSIEYSFLFDKLMCANPTGTYWAIHLNAGEAGTHYRAAKAATASRDADKAAAEFAAAAKLYPSPELVEMAAKDLGQAVKNTAMVADGTRAIPLTSDNSSLKVVAGTWQMIAPDGAAADQTHEKLEPSLTLGDIPAPPLRLEGDIEFSDWPTKDLGGGVSMISMQQTPRKTGTVALEVRLFRLYGVAPAAQLHMPFLNDNMALAVAPIQKTNRFRLDVWRGASSLSINGRPVAVMISNQLAPESTVSWFLTKTGSDADNPVRFRNLTVSPLKGIHHNTLFSFRLMLTRIDQAILKGDSAEAREILADLQAYNPPEDVLTIAGWRETALKHMPTPGKPVAIDTELPAIDDFIVTSGNWTRTSHGLNIAPGETPTGIIALPVPTLDGSFSVDIPRQTVGAFGITLGNAGGVQDIVSVIRFDHPYAAIRTSEGLTEVDNLEVPDTPVVRVTMTATRDAITLAIGGKKLATVKRPQDPIANTGDTVESMDRLSFFGLWARPLTAPIRFDTLSLTPAPRR